MRELGMRDDYSDEEKRRCRKATARTQKAVWRVCSVLHARRMTQASRLRELNHLEAVAREKGPVTQAWDYLERVYRQRPAIEAELAFLETAGPREVVKILISKTVEGGDRQLDLMSFGAPGDPRFFIPCTDGTGVVRNRPLGALLACCCSRWKGKVSLPSI
jgi:hypothetical protein